jgi:hypothetical protein
MNDSLKELSKNASEIPEYFSKVIHEYRAGNLDIAKKILEAILLKNPHSIEALKLKAMLAHRTSVFEQVIPALKQHLTSYQG